MKNETLGSSLPAFTRTGGVTVGTTSYIYPVETDNLIRNVRALADKMDRVQLLFFGREYLDDLMSPKVIAEIAAIRRDTGLELSIHLPMDLGIVAEPLKACAVVDRIIEATMAIDPVAFILHLDTYRTLEYPVIVPDEAFIDAARRALDRLKHTTGGLSDRVCIENTGYDLTAVAAPILHGPWSVCFDVGHLILSSESQGPSKISQAFSEFRSCFGTRIKELHLHGADAGKDHRGLSALREPAFAAVASLLAAYRGSAIIEVFSEADLIDSLLAWPHLIDRASEIRSARRGRNLPTQRRNRGILTNALHT